jgi:hypothetical protein
MTVQNSQEISNVNSTQDLQKSTSLHGRAFHKISDGGKVIIQSINNIAQSVLSKCIWIVSFGRYNLDSLKYLFSNQTALENKEPTASSNSPMRSAPPPPPPPPPPPLSLPPLPPTTPENLDGTSCNRSSIAKEQNLPFQGSASEALNGSLNVRSSTNSTQCFLEEDNNTLEDGTNPRHSSLHEDSHPEIEERSNNESNASPQVKKKGIKKKFEGLLAGMQGNKLFNKMKDKVDQE